MGKGGRSAGLETIDEVPSPLTFDFVKDAPKNGNGEYEQLLAEKHIDILDENNETIIRVSPHRWWVLFVFGFAAVNQAMVWMILSPSSDEFEKAYGGTFDSTYINFATNVGNGAFLLFIWPFARIVERYGPSKSTKFSCVCTFACALLRCFPWPNGVFKSVMTLSMVLSGIAGPWLNFGGPTMSETWFPIHERVTAQAIGSVSTFAGFIAGFLLGPNITVMTGDVTPDEQRGRIMILFYVEAGMCLLSLVSVFIYFPDQPEYSPSISAELKRRRKAQRLVAVPGKPKKKSKFTSIFAKNWRDYLRMPRYQRFLYLAFAVTLPLGMIQGWQSVLNLNLRDFDINPLEAGYIGFWMTTSGCVASVLFAKFMDAFTGRLKTVCCVCLTLATVCMFFIVKLLTAYDESTADDRSRIRVWLYITCIGAGFFTNISIPLQYEILVETVYGVMSEAAAVAAVACTSTIVQIILLSFPSKIGGSTIWMNWACLISYLVSWAMLVLFKVDYKRLEVDTQTGRGGAKRIGVWFDRAFGII
jgi:MFS family permease